MRVIDQHPVELRKDVAHDHQVELVERTVSGQVVLREHDVRAQALRIPRLLIVRLEVVLEAARAARARIAQLDLFEVAPGDEPRSRAFRGQFRSIGRVDADAFEEARFLAAVEKGIAAAERGEFIEEEEMDARLEAMFKV